MTKEAKGLTEVSGTVSIRLQGPAKIVDITRVWLNNEAFNVVDWHETETTCVYDLELKPTGRADDAAHDDG